MNDKFRHVESSHRRKASKHCYVGRQKLNSSYIFDSHSTNCFNASMCSHTRKLVDRFCLVSAGHSATNLIEMWAVFVQFWKRRQKCQKNRHEPSAVSVWMFSENFNMIWRGQVFAQFHLHVSRIFRLAAQFNDFNIFCATKRNKENKKRFQKERSRYADVR